jgi:hypothetical protein
MKRFFYIFLGLLIGLAVGLSINRRSVMAQSSGWEKDEVVPVVLVEYAYGNFVPVNSPGGCEMEQRTGCSDVLGEAILRKVCAQRRIVRTGVGSI